LLAKLSKHESLYVFALIHLEEGTSRKKTEKKAVHFFFLSAVAVFFSSFVPVKSFPAFPPGTLAAAGRVGTSPRLYIYILLLLLFSFVSYNRVVVVLLYGPLSCIVPSGTGWGGTRARARACVRSR